MPTPKLQQSAVDEIFRLKARGYTQKQVADMANVSIGTVNNVLRGHQGKLSDSIDQYAQYHREKFCELQERFLKWIGDTDRIKTAKGKQGKRTKALVANDLHAPFHSDRAVAEVFRQDADELWIPGDILDLFSFSRYEKYSAPFSPVEEFQCGRALLRTAAQKYPVVRVMHGNHDDRFVKWLVRDKQIPPPILEFFKLSDPNFLSPLAKICADIPNVEMMQPRELDYAKFPFIHQIGDCVLSHAEKFSKIPNRAVGEVIHWLKSYAEPQGIVEPFRLVIHAHTHQAGKTFNDYGVWGIENGCLAKVPDYAGNPKLMGAKRPSVTGYTVVYQENGKTDINATNFVQV